MELQLLKIKEKFLQKRIKRELEILINLNICEENNIKIECQNVTQNSKIVYYNCEFYNLKDNNYYKIIMSNNYPFNPPKLYVNGKSILFYHKIINFQFNKSLKKYIGINCFCCESILCDNNWGPSLTFTSILDELNIYKDVRHQILIRIILDVIKRKYLIDDINIVDWLY